MPRKTKAWSRVQRRKFRATIAERKAKAKLARILAILKE
jgi:hypothetical protein